MSNFIDYIRIHCKSGNGGSGSAHFRREKYITMGGPDGGDGGRGGNIIVLGNRNLWTLIHLRYKKHIKAGHGSPGGSSRRTGADGEDIFIEVPLGTIIRNEETGEKLAEILDHGEEKIILKGGKGGLGNTNFKSSTNQAPRYAQPGLDGSELWMNFELKVLADVGLVGFPNAGKSTLLSVISEAKPKIGDYPFTTMVPNLGVVPYRGDQSFVMADIPGIIEGAAEGKGLGTRFLRHIERNAALLFLVSGLSDDVRKEYLTLLDECKKFNADLLMKPRLVAVTKADLLDDEMKGWVQDAFKDVNHIFISSVAQLGIQELKDEIWDMIKDDKEYMH